MKFSQGKLPITQSLTHSTQCIKSWNLEKLLRTSVENETRKIKFYICIMYGIYFIVTFIRKKIVFTLSFLFFIVSHIFSWDFGNRNQHYSCSRNETLWFYFVEVPHPMLVKLSLLDNPAALTKLKAFSVKKSVLYLVFWWFGPLKILWLKFGPNVSRSFFMPQLMWFSMYPAQTLPPPPDQVMYNSVQR